MKYQYLNAEKRRFRVPNSLLHYPGLCEEIFLRIMPTLPQSLGYHIGHKQVHEIGFVVSVPLRTLRITGYAITSTSG